MSNTTSGQTIKIEGLGHLGRQLKAMEDGLQKEVTKLNRAAAEVVAATARGLAPRKSGKLAGTIRAGATLKSASVRAGSKAVPYAAPIHWGWPRHGIQANKFLYKALDQDHAEIVGVYEVGVHRLEEKVFSGGEAL